MKQVLTDSKILQNRNNFILHKDIESDCLYGKKDGNCMFSIVIPTYKRTKLLQKAIESALNQIGNANYEILIIDNTDDETYLDTLDVIKKHDSDRIRYFHNKSNIGMFGNWNRGIELAAGEWIVILNDDDLLRNNYLARMQECLSAVSELTAIIGCNHYNMINKTIMKNNDNLAKSIIRPLLSKRLFKIKKSDMFFGSDVSMVGALFSKKYALEIGGFNEKYYPTSDFIFIAANAFSGKHIYLLQDRLAVYRICENASMEFESIELFMEHQNEMKIALQSSYNFLPGFLADKYRNTSLFVFEEGLTHTWLKNEADIKKKLTCLNEKLQISTPNKCEKGIYKLFCRLRKFNFYVFRESLRI